MADEKQSFKPLRIKSIEFRNRLWVSPMCQYSSKDGHPNDWHFVHLGSRAVGGAGLVMIEATAVSPEGRISPDDSGFWLDEHTPEFKRIATFVKAQGAAIGIQLAHAGRKGSTSAPWFGGKFLSPDEGGWTPLAPSEIPFDKSSPPSHAMTQGDMAKVIKDFEKATDRVIKAGFQVLELHFAHGYLIHEFLSPLSNKRGDEFGGSFENRVRFPLELTRAVRARWPQDLPLFVRISATDWADGAQELTAAAEGRATNSNSWKLADSIAFAKKLKELGVDLIDCSSGGTLPNAEIPTGPGYQVPFSQAIRREAKIMTAAVGMITEPTQAEAVLLEQQADAIFMAREFLRDPYFPARAAKELGAKIQKPKQYGRS